MRGPGIRLHALNLGERVLARFEHLFAAAGRGAAMLVNETVAEVVLVDLDMPGAGLHLADYRRRNPGRPALVLARAPETLEPGDEALAKPVVIRDLLLALQRLRRTLTQASTAWQEAPTEVRTRQPSDDDLAADPPTMVMPRTRAGEATVVMPRGARADATGEDTAATLPDDEPSTRVAAPSPEPTAAFAVDAEAVTEVRAPLAASPEAEDPMAWADLCGLGEDVDPHDEDAVEQLWVSGDGLLLARLAAAARQALDSQRALELHTGTLKIVLDGAADYAYSDRDERAVQGLCAGGPLGGSMAVTPAGKPKAVLLNRGGAPTAHWPTVESAVWQAALWTYRGRLPAGTSIVERVYLSRWPNFTRLCPLPHGLRIAALWTEQPLSLAETAAVLGIPQRYVFALYGAAHALGLSGPARRAADHLFETAPAMLVPARPLLRRLVARLRAPRVDDAASRGRAAG